MIFPNNNKHIIKKLCRGSLNNNKSRNIIIVIAIALTTILFSTLFTVSLGVVKTIQEQSLKRSGTSAHLSLIITEDQFDNLKENFLIDKIGYSKLIGTSENKLLVKRPTELRYGTEEYAKMTFSNPTIGELPTKEDEIATDTLVLDLLGIPNKIGEKIKLDYNINGEKFTKEFILSGYWEGDPVIPSSMIYVSEDFTLDTSINKDNQSNPILASIMFKNSFDIREKTQKLIMDSGYSINANDSNYINHAVNWAYLSTDFKLTNSNFIPILVVCMLIIFTGYLIIYNIFQISVLKDIRLYALLKTIGTSSKQIKKLILRQGFLLSIIGIPIGLLFGFIIGVIFLPMIIKNFLQISSYSISFNPFIFIFSSLFSLLTVIISCRKPGKIAANFSPIEGIKYNGNIESNNKKIRRKTSRLGKIYSMAFSNLSRNKKQTFIVVISISLSLVLLNSVFTYIKAFDMNKYLDNSLNTDFLVAHTNYFKYNFREKSDEVSEDMINSIKTQKGFINGGRIFYDINFNKIIFNDTEKNLQLFGLEDFPMENLTIIEGKMDKEKFKSGKYIIEGGNLLKDSSYKIGDKVTLKLSDGVYKTYEIMAKAEAKNSFHVRYYYDDNVIMYLPFDDFSKLIKEPLAMNFIFNVSPDNIDNFESFLKDYTTNLDPIMNYDSKTLFLNKFKDMQNLILILGGSLSIIIGLIGLLNFINSILTTIIARKKEFAILQSIGMTNKQLLRLLIYEGLLYSGITSLMSIILGSLFSFVILKKLLNNMWFTNYSFTLYPLLITIPLIAVISIIIPLIIYRFSSNESVVEKLKELD